MGTVSRVFFVCPEFPVAAGGSTYIENMGGAFQAAGYDVSVASLYSGSHPTALSYQTVLGDRGYFTRPLSGGRNGINRLKHLPRAAVKRWRRFYRLRKAAQALQALGQNSLVVFTHVHALIAMKEGGFNPSTCQAVLVGQHHSPYASLELEPALKIQIQEHFPELDVLTALSTEDAEGFEQLTGTRCFSMPNPVPPTASTPDSESSGEPRLVGIGRFTAEKRFPLMVKLASDALNDASLRDWRFVLFGDGPERHAIEEQAESSLATKQIRLPGRTLDPVSELRRSRIHLVTSAYEGFSLTTLEAATQGVPTVAFDVSPGLRELMRALGGVLVEEGDEAEYIRWVQRLMTDPKEWARRSSSARDGARLYSGAAVVERWQWMIRVLNGGIPG